MKNYRQFQRHESNYLPPKKEILHTKELVCGCSSVTYHLNVTTLAKHNSQLNFQKSSSTTKLLVADGAVGSRRSTWGKNTEQVPNEPTHCIIESRKMQLRATIQVCLSCEDITESALKGLEEGRSPPCVQFFSEKTTVQLEHEMQDLATELSIYPFSVFSSHQNIPAPQQIYTKQRNQSLFHLSHHVSLVPHGCDCLVHRDTKTSASHTKLLKTPNSAKSQCWEHIYPKSALPRQ